MRNEKRRELAAVAIIFLVLLGYLWSLLRSPVNRIINDEDGVMIAWEIDRVSNKLFSLDVKHFWDGGIFYPWNAFSLAFSDSYLPQALLSLLLRLFTTEPIVIANYLTILAVVLMGVITYFLLHELSNDRWLALTATLTYLFSPFYISTIGHLHSAAIYGVPLAFLALLKIKQGKHPIWYVIWGASFVFQTATSFLSGFFIILITLFFWKQFATKAGLISGLISGFILTPVVWPYLKVAEIFNYQRPMTDLMHFSMSLNDLWGKYGNLGLYLLWLGGWVAIKKRLIFYQPYWLLTLIAGILALGPALKWQDSSVKIPWHIPLPYAGLYYLVPGINGIRAVGRWALLFGLTGTVAAVSSLKKYKYKQILGLLTLSLTLMRLPSIKPQYVPERADYPSVYYWLKEQPKGPVLELPIASWGQGEKTKNEIWRMLYQTEHNQPLVNGYSGFSPLVWEEMIQKPDTLIELVKPQYVLIHDGQPLNRDDYQEEIAIDGVRVYRSKR